jgi:NTE family protein
MRAARARSRTGRRRVHRTRRRRRGLVLGAGGPLGAAWTAGALAALQDRLECPLGELDVLVGTSAGSILACALRCGVDVDAIVAHQRGRTVPGLPDSAEVEAAAHTGLPPLPLPGLGSPRLLLAAALAPLRHPPAVLASACLPTGRGRLDAVEDLVRGLQEHAGLPADGWVPGRTWLVALDYDRGRRTAFGHPDAPSAPLPAAVAASCAIPAWYRPVSIDGSRYVDGGCWSTTSLDLLAGLGLDEVHVLAPMASEIPDRPRDPLTRLERRFRRHVTAALRREAAAVEASGTTVHLITPGPEDLAVMGANLMDARRRRDVLETSLLTSEPGVSAAA